MEELITRLLMNLHERVAGPMSFRLVLQPTMAAIFAIRDGLQDARTGRPPYFWAILTDSRHRTKLVREGWKSVAKIFMLAVVLDVIFQFIQLRRLYPGEALLVAFVLAIVPYLLIRGIANRIARGRESRRTPSRT